MSWRRSARLSTLRLSQLNRSTAATVQPVELPETTVPDEVLDAAVAAASAEPEASTRSNYYEALMNFDVLGATCFLAEDAARLRDLINAASDRFNTELTEVLLAACERPRNAPTPSGQSREGAGSRQRPNQADSLCVVSPPAKEAAPATEEALS